MPSAPPQPAVPLATEKALLVHHYRICNMGFCSKPVSVSIGASGLEALFKTLRSALLLHAKSRSLVAAGFLLLSVCFELRERLTLLLFGIDGRRSATSLVTDELGVLVSD